MMARNLIQCSKLCGKLQTGSKMHSSILNESCCTCARV